MGTLVLTNAFVSLGGNDISDHVDSITINYSADTVESTAMGDGTHLFKAGLKNWDASISLKNDFADNEIDEILFNMVGTEVAMDIRPVNTTIGTGNPSYAATALVESYPPLGNGVGELAKTTVTLKAASTLVRDVSP